MKNAEVKINGLYLAKVTNRTVTIKITAKHKSGGWHAINTVTNKKIHIKTAARLQGPAKPEPNAKLKKKPADKPAIYKKPEISKLQNPEKKLSLVAAAIQILEKTNEPLSCKDIIEQVTQQQLWKPAKGGKTPANTLYAAFLREIKTKGEKARFIKASPGKFALNK